MATDTSVTNLIINKLTKAQYSEISEPSETEIYLVPDEIDDTPTANSVNPVKSGGLYTALGTKQDTLTSGVTIKTINNESLLGSGNITIQGSTGSGGNAKIFAGTCSTAAATTAKIVVCNDFTSSDLVRGVCILVTFDATNSGAVGSLTMNVNDTGTFPIKKTLNNGAPSNLNNAGEIRGNDTYLFQWNGTYWVCMSLDFNTTYSAMTQAIATTGTETTGKLISAKVLNDTILQKADKNVIETIKVNGTALEPDEDKAVDITLSSVLSESDPVFTASAAYGITSSDITNWNTKTDNVGTITGITMNGASKGTSGVVDLGTVITSETTLSKGTTTGTGNAVTDITVSGHQITLTKGDTFAKTSDLATVATSGSYNDLSNKPTIPAAQVQSDWNATTGMGVILNKPTIPSAPGTLKTNNTTAQTASASESLSGTINLHKVAKTGTYSDLIGTPTIPSAPGTLTTTATAAQSTATNESLSGNIALHKVSKTGSYNDLNNKPTIPTVNNATITIKNGSTTLGTFTVNASSNVEIDISSALPIGVPTYTSADNGKILGVVNGQLAWITPTTIYTGSGTPSSSTGNDGDIYLQTS